MLGKHLRSIKLKKIKILHPWCLLACAIIDGLIALSSFYIFGSNITRWGASFTFMKDAWTIIIRAKDVSDGVTIKVPNAGTMKFEGVQTSFVSFIFLFQAAAGLMTNVHWIDEWWSKQSDKLLNFIQFLQYLPFPFIGYFLLTNNLKKTPKKGQQNEKTKELVSWEKFTETIKPKLQKIKTTFSSYLTTPSSGYWWKWAWVGTVIVMSPLGPAFLDYSTGYFYLMFSARIDAFLPLIVSNMTDFAITFADLGLLNAIWIGWIIFLILRYSALSTLRKMQEADFERIKTPAVGIFTAAPPGMGKTQMDTSMAIDYQYLLRQILLDNIHEARNAFPHFPFKALEAWINKKTKPTFDKVPALINEFGSVLVPPCNETTYQEAELNTRAQIELAIKAAYQFWIKKGKVASIDGIEYFFGYDGKKEPISYFDGAKNWTLEDAIISYAQSYFLYNSGLSLMTSNYSILDRTGEDLSSFSLYGSDSDYLRHGCQKPAEACGFSQVLEWDPFRFGKKVDPDKMMNQIGHFDGGAWVGDELNLERGNRNVHYGKGKAGDQTTPENDNFNYSPRVWRHLFSINGRCISKMFGNGQRIAATNSDLISIFEQIDWIQRNDGEENALPLWRIDNMICNFVINAANKWLDLCQNKEFKQSLLNHFVFMIAKPFADHQKRMRNSYGFERLHVSSSLAKNEADGSGDSENSEYYIIYRKMRAYTYKTDAFHALVEQQALGSSEGYLRAPHYKALDPTMQNYDDSASYIVKTMLDCMADYQETANKRVKKISEMAKKGTNN